MGVNIRVTKAASVIVMDGIREYAFASDYKDKNFFVRLKYFNYFLFILLNFPIAPKR